MTTQILESKYCDPDNTKEILEELSKCATIGDVNLLIKRVFPDWQVAVFSKFCTGYPHLNSNWNILCSRIGVEPTQVLVVRELSFEDNHTLLRTFVECLTRSGFAVRRMSDYIPCSKCSSIAVPTPQIHELMKEKGVQVPDINIPTCYACRS